MESFLLSLSFSWSSFAALLSNQAWSLLSFLGFVWFLFSVNRCRDAVR